MNKEPRVSVRVSEDLKKRLETVSGKTGIDEATLVRNCLEALVNHIESEGEITFPLAVLPKSKTTNDRSKYPDHRDQSSLVEDKPNPKKPKKDKEPPMGEVAN